MKEALILGEIAQWLLLIVKCSVDETSDLSGYPPVEMYGMNVKRFLRLPSGTARPVVTRVSRADSNEGDGRLYSQVPSV